MMDYIASGIHSRGVHFHVHWTFIRLGDGVILVFGHHFRIFQTTCTPPIFLAWKRPIGLGGKVDYSVAHGYWVERSSASIAWIENGAASIASTWTCEAHALFLYLKLLYSAHVYFYPTRHHWSFIYTLSPQLTAPHGFDFSVDPSWANFELFKRTDERPSIFQFWYVCQKKRTYQCKLSSARRSWSRRLSAWASAPRNSVTRYHRLSHCRSCGEYFD